MQIRRSGVSKIAPRLSLDHLQSTGLVDEFGMPRMKARVFS